jgi:hypothetical protein
MTIYPLILLLVVTGQDKPKPDTPEDRARRAAIVDRIMTKPILPKAQVDRPADEAVQRALAERQALLREEAARALAAERAAAVAARNRQQVRVRVMGRQGAALKSITLEQPDTKDREQDGEVDPPEPVVPMVRGLNLNEAVLDRENFDTWIFGDGSDEEGRRVRLQTVLSERIDRVMKDHDINKTQLQKLRIAGSGDIKRFLDRVEERRPEFEVARTKFNTGFALLQELEPLSAEFQEGPFGADSFFAKTLKRIESDAKGASKDER